MRHTVLFRFMLSLSVFASCSLPGTSAIPTSLEESRCQEGPASRDGTGRFYMGRGIAPVMGFQGAAWLDRSSRKQEERPGLLLKTLDIQPGQAVADIGAGTGYHTRPMARAVGPQGKVFAVDVQPEMLQLLSRSLK